MYIIALLFKIPVAFVLMKAHIKLGEEKELSQNAGNVSSPIGSNTAYTQNSPYDPAPINTSSFSINSPGSEISASQMQVEMTEMSPSGLPSPPVVRGYARTPPAPPNVGTG